MYVPVINAMTDKTEIVAFMKQFSFATIITAKDNLPLANHLPFLITIKDGNVILYSHFAKANEQWKEIESNKVLVIFSEPHAYISPKHYDNQLSVPTWNYVSVQAYGTGSLLTDTEEIMELLEDTIDNYDITYRHQWNTLPEEFKSGMAKGIVAFSIVVTDIQAKKKLSQNKTKSEQLKIINSLSKSIDTNEQQIAKYMENNLDD